MRTRLIAALTVGALGLGPATAAAAVPANGDSFAPALSCDGRYVLFTSWATNLVPGDTNGTSDVFVRDVAADVTHRVSEGAGHVQANGDSFAGDISCDGRYVVFSSTASNLVRGDTNRQPDVFIRDRVRGTIRRLSLGPAGRQANAGSGDPLISGDGRFVAFQSGASNLVRGDTNGKRDVFVRDRGRARTRRASVGNGGRQASGGLGGLSANGRYVTFISRSRALLPAGVSMAVFVRDRGTARTTLVSRDAGGAPFDAAGDTAFAPPTAAPVSADGRYVGFLVQGGDFNVTPVEIRDRRQPATMDVPSAGGMDRSLAIAGGRLAYWSKGVFASGLEYCSGQVYVTGMARQPSTAASAPAGVDPCSRSEALGGAALSEDGRFAAFDSGATDLVAGDTNGSVDVFVRELSTGDFTLVSTP
jgi:hypothetical protein